MTETIRPDFPLRSHFNSHPHKEDDFTFLHLIVDVLYFNSHPHKEDDPCADCELYKKNISTHILTRRMTCCAGLNKVKKSHFNSHPHKEDDVVPCSIYLPGRYFNSHPHKEDDGSFCMLCTDFRKFQLTSSQGG